MAQRPDVVPATFVVERPWGRYEQLASAEVVTVKVITVMPGCRLSLQRHAHRSESWYVLDGPVDVLVDGVDRVLHVGEQIMVPVGAVHRLGNPGTRPARVLEIARGDFDEADIERLQDDYAR